MTLRTQRLSTKFIDGHHCRYRCLPCPALGVGAWRIIAEPRSPTARRWAPRGASLLETFAHEHQLNGVIASVERTVGYAERREAAAAVRRRVA